MNKTYCDKCGKEIIGSSLNWIEFGHFVPSRRTEFCDECFFDIYDYALPKS